MTERKNKKHRHDRLDTVEKKLLEYHRSKVNETVNQIPDSGSNWMQRVMETIETLEPPRKEREKWFKLKELQVNIVWRFSGTAAAFSLILVIAFMIVTGDIDLNIDLLVNMLMDPLTSVGLNWMVG